MRAIFLILFVFASFIIILGVSSKSTDSSTLGNTLIVGGVVIYLGILATWIAFKVGAKSNDKDR